MVGIIVRLAICKHSHYLDISGVAFNAKRNPGFSYECREICIIRIWWYSPHSVGEMSSDQLHETLLDPSTRHLIRITMNDTSEASRACSILMGADTRLKKIFAETGSYIDIEHK